jgi:hypothetical protein
MNPLSTLVLAIVAFVPAISAGPIKGGPDCPYPFDYPPQCVKICLTGIWDIPKDQCGDCKDICLLCSPDVFSAADTSFLELLDCGNACVDPPPYTGPDDPFY